MEDRKEQFIKASEERIYSWAEAVGSPIEAIVKTAIIAELRTMYDEGYNSGWDTSMAVGRD